MARSSAAASWLVVREDPGLLLALLRHASDRDAALHVPALLEDPALLESILLRLERNDRGWADWSSMLLAPIHQANLATARLAEAAARLTRRADPDQAWMAGLLAPLGWIAVAAVDPAVARAALDASDGEATPVEVQRRLWGMDQSALARRLARRWRLPGWLTAVVGHLDLPADSAAIFGAPADLVRVVQTAMLLSRRLERWLPPTPSVELPEVANALGLASADLELLDREARQPTHLPALTTWECPIKAPLLADFLRLAIEKRRLESSRLVERLEADVDHLHECVRVLHEREEKELRQRTLLAMAEFAAGAGHEINNPLAVISGQAQYLLHHALEPSQQKALQVIVGQTQRIHLILTELMQFARPSRPKKAAVEIGALFRETAASLAGLAEEKKVQLRFTLPESPLWIEVDPKQARLVLAGLWRNAIEAAPPGSGIAGARIHSDDSKQIVVAIEDNGPGPTPSQRTVMFDPFYSGRQAGRGRGLGLSVAWRLARENGGEVVYDGHRDGTTCFLLSLPRSALPFPVPCSAPSGAAAPPDKALPLSA
jgi:signal transduction histidine kinase